MIALTDLAGAFLYFTLLLPIWEQRPLEHEDIFPGKYPLEVSREDVLFARQGFQYADEDLREAMVRVFGRSLSPDAREVLLERAREESAAPVVASILLQVGNLPLDAQALAARLARYFKHDDWQTRFWAVSVYARLPGAQSQRLLEVALEDDSERVKVAALQGLFDNAEDLAYDGIVPLLTSENAAVRRAAWQVAPGTRGIERNNLKPLLTDPDVSLRCALARGLAGLPPFQIMECSRVLATDEHPSVRAETALQLAAVRTPEARQILLALAVDADYEVRRSAEEALQAFAEASVVQVLAERLADPVKFVRDEAEDSLVAIHRRLPVDEITAGMLKSPNPDGRLHAANALGRVGEKKQREPIAENLPKETRPENIVAMLLALDKLGYDTSDDKILAHMQHPDKRVRQAMARALANFETDKADAALITLTDDSDRDVVGTAVESMGRMGRMVFADRLLFILKATGMSSPFTGTHRGKACWAIAKLPALTNGLQTRLVEQGTTPVIPTMDGPIFEDDVVLSSVAFALAEQTRKNPQYRPLFNRVYDIQGRVFTDQEMMQVNSAKTLIPSAELVESNRQAKAWVEGEAVTRKLRPKSSMRFLYKPLRIGRH